MPQPGTTRIGDLEIAQDVGFQRRSWRVQRVAWVAMVGVVLAALLGYTGDGPRSEGRAVSSDGAYRFEYPRYARHRAPSVLRVVVDDGVIDGDEARLAFSRPYLDGVGAISVPGAGER